MRVGYCWGKCFHEYLIFLCILHARHWLPFKLDCLSKEQSWKIWCLPSEQSTGTGTFKIFRFPKLSFFPVIQSTVCSDVIWPSSHHLWELGLGNQCKMLIL